jgi:hypothetical protein
MTKINLKINKMIRSLSLGAIALCFAFGTVANAQITSTTDINLSKDGGDGVSVKLVDNKGTIKYLQSTNGITTITSETAGSKTTTTWQLGGTIEADTYIDVNGNVFGLDGLKLETGDASTDATDQSDHGTGTGWTIVVRDEATGEFRKLLPSSMVTAGTADDVVDGGEETANVIAITALDIPTAAAARGKIWVYRNGVKLSQLTDYAITANTVTVTGTADFDIYTGDVFEVQWIN